MLNPSKVNGVNYNNQNFMEDNIVQMQNPYNLLNPTSTNKQVINPMQASPGEYNPMAQYQQQGIQLNFNQLNTSTGNARVNTSQTNQSLNISNSKDMSTSKSRSKNNAKNKNYQVQINDDIVLIERIEGVLSQITNNHNRVCPYSSRST
jgi:hypothetical protein